jgi:hypothetical protein
MVMFGRYLMRNNQQVHIQILWLYAFRPSPLESSWWVHDVFNPLGKILAQDEFNS